MQNILDYLRKRGQQLDSEIAAATGLPLADVRSRLAELSKKGDIMTCHSTRFLDDGEKLEGLLCRATGSGSCVSPVKTSKLKSTLKVRSR